MSVPANTLAPELARKLAQLCKRSSCGAPLEGDANFCREHHEADKVHKRASAKRRRARLRKAKRCVDCRKPSRKRRCRECWKKSRGGRIEPRGVEIRSSAKPARGHYKTEVFADGAARTRYVGQSHRGGPTREEQDASLVKLVLDARRLLDGFLRVFPEERAQIDALPRVQRSEAWELLASSLTRSARLQLEVAASLAPTWRATCAGCGRANEGE